MKRVFDWTIGSPWFVRYFPNHLMRQRTVIPITKSRLPPLHLWTEPGTVKSKLRKDPTALISQVVWIFSCWCHRLYGSWLGDEELGQWAQMTSAKLIWKSAFFAKKNLQFWWVHYFQISCNASSAWTCWNESTCKRSQQGHEIQRSCWRSRHKKHNAQKLGLDSSKANQHQRLIVVRPEPTSKLIMLDHSPV